MNKTSGTLDRKIFSLARIVKLMFTPLALAWVIALPTIAAAQSPAGCTANNLNFPLNRIGAGSGPNGYVVSWQVGVTNDDPQPGVVLACDWTNITASFCCPGPDGNPSPTSNTCSGTVGENCCFPLLTNATIRAGNPGPDDNPNLATFQCRNVVNPGVTKASAGVIGAGTEQDIPGGTQGNAIQRTQSVTILPCLVQVDKEISCDGGATFHDVGEVSNQPANGVCQDTTVEGCTATQGTNIIVRYKTNNPNTFQLFGCTVSDSNGGILGNPLDADNPQGGQEQTLPDQNAICSDTLTASEPDTATVNCFCTAELDSRFTVRACDVATFSCPAICGDNTINRPGETCDGTDLDATSCTSCRAPGSSGECTCCGDGIVNDGEQCDHGATNGAPGDSCDANCVIRICGDGIVGNTPGEECDPPGSACTKNGATGTCDATCKCPVCGDGIVGNTPGEVCDPPGSSCTPAGGGTATCDSACQCPAPPMGGCRVTGGGTVDACGTVGNSDCDPATANCAPACADHQSDALDATHGGQVGASIGIATPFTADSPCIKGEWSHVRHIRPRLNGNFHARSFDSLECACLPCAENPDAPGVVGVLCNPGDRICGPEPRRAPDNKICFSGAGDYTLTNGKRDRRSVVFRVDVEDRSEPGGTNGPEPPDRYRIRIWLVDADSAAGLALRPQVACSATSSGEDLDASVAQPDIDDGGDLIRGNQQIHPPIKDTCSP